MSSISDRLKSLGVSIGTSNIKPPKPPQDGEYPIDKVLAGEFWHTSSGEIFVVETKYRSDFLRGSVKLKPSSSLDLIAAYAQSPQIANFDIERFAFMDTETTGLGLGTGVYTFMVGIGRFDGGYFRLAQFFLRDPSEETAQLAAIEEFLAPCEAWVTFNGKAFDVPLINNRFTINGWPIPLQNAPHIDLLHLARRLWKERLPSRSLGDLEAKILGATRSQADVPGWMIPDLYFDYLHTRDARPLLGIFYHNEMDVISLAALLANIADILSNPFDDIIQHGLDRIAVGKLYADLGYLDIAVEIYQLGLQSEDLQSETYWQALKELSFLHKKQSNLESACHLWEQAANNNQIYANVELAKVLEHQQKDYSAAIHWTQSAIEVVSEPDFPLFDREVFLPELEHRLERLKRKLTANLR